MTLKADCRSLIIFLLCLLNDVNIRGSLAQYVKVLPEVVSYTGQTVALPCQFAGPGQMQLTQVSWIFETTTGVRTNIAIFNPAYGVAYPKSQMTGRVGFTTEPPQLEKPTLQITDIKKTDEGQYICEYATYPSGNEQGITRLTIQGSLAPRVKVPAEMMSYTGQTVTLSCQFPDRGQTRLTQVAWIFETTTGVRTNIAVFNPLYGVAYPKSPVKGRVSFMTDPPQLENPTIQITDIKKTDEGKYICEYSIYPMGKEQGITKLTITVKCSPPPEVQNGQPDEPLKEEYGYGHTVTYRCNAGFTLVGAPTISCSVNGTFQPNPPECTAHCVKPSEGDNRVLAPEFVKPSYVDGETAMFQCSVGYQPVDPKASKFITCSGNKWTELPLQCQTVKCSPPPEVQNGQPDHPLKEEYDYGQTVTYRCNAGFTLFGAPTISCSANGTFQPNPPECTDFSTERVRVQPEVVSYLGQVVTLQCQIADPHQSKPTQASWIFETTAGVRSNIAVFHPLYGVVYPRSPVKGRVSFTTEPPQLESPTLQITDIKKTDEGKYICEYATYPSGNEQGITRLTIQVIP